MWFYEELFITLLCVFFGEIFTKISPLFTELAIF